MARKVLNKAKVVKKPSAKAAAKPKGKVVKATIVEDVRPDIKETSKEVKTNGDNDSLVEEAKLNKALEELEKFVAKTEESKEGEKSQLFEDELVDNLQLVFTKKELFTSKKNFKPKLIHIQNKPQPETKPNVILFIRDGIVDSNLLDEIEKSELNNVLKEIIAGSELKTTYKQYEKRRELFSQNDLFLADDSLITSLPKLLGKTFYDSNKIPIPIKINKDKFSIQSTLNHTQKILNSIVYHVPRSNHLTINLGSIESVNASVLKQVINHFKEEDLRAIFIKTNQSPSLPLYEVDTVYTDADVVDPSKNIIAKINEERKAVNVEGLPENIKLSEFEKGLIELANPQEIPQLFASKIKKSVKQAKKEAKNKVSKPIIKSKKSNGTKQVKKVKA